MTNVVVIAGASGFIGAYLLRAYREQGYTVRTIGRFGADALWGDADALVAVLDGAQVLINLAGKSVNCRYTAANRAEILRSRVQTTRQLGDAVAACQTPPVLWLNSSTATIYRHADDRPMTEADGDIGAGFSVGVATAWENEFFRPELPSTRRVALRLAIVLGEGSALTPLTVLSRLGLGGAQLDGHWPASRARLKAGTQHRFGTRGGRQRFSWVHIEDVLDAIRFIEADPRIGGVVNVSAPGVSTSVDMMAAVRRVLRVPFGMPAFRWMLELGSFVIRTETELVLKSRWVQPERLVAAGFSFRFTELEPALIDILSHRKRA